jgi:hypothetical protein
MEELKLRSPSGIAKLTGVALCLAGVLVIALYAGELLSAVNHHHAFVAAPTHAASATAPKTLMGATWIKGTFMAVLAALAYVLWLILQVSSTSANQNCIHKYKCSSINFTYYLTLYISVSIHIGRRAQGVSEQDACDGDTMPVQHGAIVLSRSGS